MKEKIGFYSYVDLTLLTNAEIFDIITLVNRGVAQLVARDVWDVDAAGSNPVTPTIFPLDLIQIRFSVFL